MFGLKYEGSNFSKNTIHDKNVIYEMHCLTVIESCIIFQLYFSLNLFTGIHLLCRDLGRISNQIFWREFCNGKPFCPRQSLFTKQCSVKNSPNLFSFQKREIDTLLGDILKHLNVDRAFENYYPQVKTMANLPVCMFSCFSTVHFIFFLSFWLFIVHLFAIYA